MKTEGELRGEKVWQLPFRHVKWRAAMFLVAWDRKTEPNDQRLICAMRRKVADNSATSPINFIERSRTFIKC